MPFPKVHQALSKSGAIKLAVSLVVCNAEKYLPFCLKSIFNQTFQDFILLVIDNGSTDQTVRYLKENYPQIKVVEHRQNIGFAKAHNQAISWSASDYLCLINQDVILEPDYFLRTVEFLDSHPEVGSVSGKFFQWDYQNNQKTGIVDSLGLRIFNNHRVIDIGQGKNESAELNQTSEIFGVSGCASLYRRFALEAVKLKSPAGHDEYFDELFFSYKEDVDLSWRLRLAGFSAYLVPLAVAYHDRTITSTNNLNHRAIIASRRERDKLVRIYSYKNHLQTLFKNEFFTNFLRYFFPIFWYEFKKIIYCCLFEQATLQGLAKFLKEWRLIWQKRKYIIKNIRKVKAKEIAGWFEK